MVEFLPVGEIKGLNDPRRGIRSRSWPRDATEFLFEPSAGGSSVAICLAHYLNIFIYRVLLEAKASEQSARMVAMKNATDNATA